MNTWNLPEYIDLDTIEGIASEDIWEELLDINLSVGAA